LATIKEVAKRAGVSIGTVSHVLGGRIAVSQELRQRVEQAMTALDYHPNHAAQMLKRQKTQLLGMILSDITNPFYPLLVRGAEAAAAEQGYMLTIFNTDDRADREKATCASLRRRVDGVLIVPSLEQSDSSHLQDLRSQGVQIVCVDREPLGVDLDAVVSDNVAGAAMCVRHLTSLGHRHIAAVMGRQEFYTARERLKGYQFALSEAGIAYDPGLLCEGDFRRAQARQQTIELLQRRKDVTAIFAANGMAGLGAFEALHQLGLKCPEDISLVLLDDVQGGDVFHPRLTVVVQPAYAMGYQAMQLLLRRISGDPENRSIQRIFLMPELLIRDSTRKLNH
jgi:LacI family transcriptional regulator